ncbi:hypothetical protein [Phenylobacterium sp.]|nr:hypothetical protein [Phenylobacterium sp.]
MHAPLANRGVDVQRRNLIWLAVRVGGGGPWTRSGAAKQRVAAEQHVSNR